MSRSKEGVNIQIGGGSSSLFIIFLILKLTNTIDWSWWWVTAPLWIPFAIIGVILLGMAVFFGVAALLGIK